MMRRMFDGVAMIAIAFVLVACETPYQKKGFGGGYEDAHIRDNIYYVDVLTNASTSQTTAAVYFHRRAKELCIENGYQDYQIYKERNASGAVGTYGGGVAGVSQTPGFAGYVECLGIKK